MFIGLLLGAIFFVICVVISWCAAESDRWEAERKTFFVAVLAAVERLTEEKREGFPRAVRDIVQNTLERQFALTSVYDALEEHHRKGFVLCALVGEKRRYSITPAGVQFLIDRRSRDSRILDIAQGG